jgi:hypothetical protein
LSIIELLIFTVVIAASTMFIFKHNFNKVAMKGLHVW